MERMECRRRRKVDAERQRRNELNNRLDRLRNLLELDTQLTRIQVLDEAANRLDERMNWLPGKRLMNNPSNHIMPTQVIDPFMYFPNSFNTTTMPAIGMIQKERSNKALIEQNRRQLERQALNRVRLILGIERISDVCLLDRVISLFLSVKSSKFLLNDEEQSTQIKPRRPLQAIDINIRGAGEFQAPFEFKPDQYGCNTLARKSKNPDASIDFWRPWEPD